MFTVCTMYNCSSGSDYTSYNCSSNGGMNADRTSCPSHGYLHSKEDHRESTVYVELSGRISLSWVVGIRCEHYIE